MSQTQTKHRQQQAMMFTTDYMAVLFQMEDQLERMVSERVEEAVEQKMRQMNMINDKP